MHSTHFRTTDISGQQGTSPPFAAQRLIFVIIDYFIPVPESCGLRKERMQIFNREGKTNNLQRKGFVPSEKNPVF